jgi:hypothetical protein
LNGSFGGVIFVFASEKEKGGDEGNEIQSALVQPRLCPGCFIHTGSACVGYNR